MSGWIYPAGDEDWFAFAAQEHATYRLEASPGTQEPQVDPLLRLLGRDGVQTLIVDEDGGQDEAARIEWVAPATDTYYVSVAAGHTSATGTYSILLAEDLDDHADSAERATSLDAGASLSGRVEHVGDGDWFAFAAETGTTYRASVSPGTLASLFLRLVDSGGVNTLRTDEAPDQDGAFRIEWVAPAAGMYYLSVGAGSTHTTGTYTITLAHEADDHANNADGATELIAGATAAGGLEATGDQDWFRFAATAGTEHRFSTPAAPEGLQLELFGSNGTTKLLTEASDLLGPARIEWIAPADATYYLAVRTSGSAELSRYLLKLTAVADDHPDVPTGAASLGVDTPVNGTLETRGDEDWFAFAASEGWVYRISLAPGSLPESTLALLDQNATSRIQMSADESPFIEWMAPISGTYYLRVRAPLGASTGSYTLSMSAEGDDYSDESPGAAEIGTDGSPATGKIETAGDLDWFSFPVQPETRYTITLVSGSLRTARMDLYGAVIVDGIVRDGIGYTAGTTHYADPGVSVGGDTVAFDGWSTFASGTHFIRVSSHAVDGLGTYMLSVIANGSSGLFTGVYDTVASAGEGGGVIVALRADEHPNTAASATPLVMGDTVFAALGLGGDEDVFSFDAVAGSTYRFETTAVTLADPDLTLYEPDGASVIASDYDSGEGKAARIEWTAPASDTYYVQVGSRAYSGNSRTGTYWLTLSAEPSDHGSAPETATAVSFGAAAANFAIIPGDLEVADDRDWFAFEAVAGRIYRLETRLGSLADSDLTLYGQDGETMIEADYDSGEGKASRIEWTAPGTDTYYVKVGSRFYSGNPRVGSYALTVSSEPDDHSGTAADATPVPVSTKVATNITIPCDLEVAGDEDWFAFEAVAGWVYRLETTLGSLADSDLEMYAPDGTTRLAYDYDSGQGKASRIEWTAPGTDTYYVKAGSRAYSGNPRVGTYTLTISGEPDDHGGDHPGATQVPLGTTVANYATLPGDLTTSGDEDWFSFDAAEGWTYRLETGPGSLADPDLSLYAPDGTSVVAYDYDSGEGKASRIEWVAPASDTYYVTVGSRFYSGNPGVGTYTLTISGEPD